MNDFNKISFEELKLYQDKFESEYEEYTSEVSTKAQAISLELSAFLYWFCKDKEITSILDLGSGFSSYVFNTYSQNVSLSVNVTSIDDHDGWLEKTKQFLLKNRISDPQVLHLDSFDFQSSSFDLVFHDLGSMDVRKNSFHNVVSSVSYNDGFIVLDDMHKKDYERFVSNNLKKYSCDHLSLKNQTLDDFGRFSTLLSNVEVN